MTPLPADLAQTSNESIATLVARCWTLGRTGHSSAGLAAAKHYSSLAMGSGDLEAAAQASNQIAWFSLQLGLLDEGYDAAVEAKLACGEIGDLSGQAIASSLLSWLLVEMGLVDEAFIEAETALGLAERQSSTHVLAFAQNAKAVTYLYCRQDHLALPLLLQALDTLGQDEAPSLRALFLTNIGYSQLSRSEMADLEGDHDAADTFRSDAITNNDLAIDIAARHGDIWNLRTALCNGAEYYACIGQMTVADQYLDRWQHLPGDIGLRAEIHYLYTRGEVLTKAGRLDEALKACVAAVDLAAANKQADHKANSFRRLAEVYEALGNHREALAYYKKFHAAFETQMGETTRRRAQHVETTLEAAQLRQQANELRFQAEHDALTGVPNRRSFEWALKKAEGSLYCLGILDIDHFKSVNDNHSHAVGDTVLRTIAETLTRTGGVDVYRLGGEEFALIFAGHTPASAIKLAERMRLAITAISWEDISQNLSVTASIGLVSADEAPAADLMGIADRRLYQAKKTGRNRVVALDLPVTPEAPSEGTSRRRNRA